MRSEMTRPGDGTPACRERKLEDETLEAPPVNTPSPLNTDELLATAAHELRLPVSQIKRFVTTLRRTDIDWDDAARSEFLAEIDMETERLADLVGSLCTPRSAELLVA